MNWRIFWNVSVRISVVCNARAILESRLFYIAVEDNEWSMAIELLQKKDPCDNHLLGLQKRYYQRYLNGMKKCLESSAEHRHIHRPMGTRCCRERDAACMKKVIRYKCHAGCHERRWYYHVRLSIALRT